MHGYFEEKKMTFPKPSKRTIIEMMKRKKKEKLLVFVWNFDGKTFNEMFQ